MEKVIFRHRAAALLAALIAYNAVAWAWAFLTFHGLPALLGTTLLAYSFGLRHAFDADHIVAIDNVTRKLMHDGQRPVTTGLFFSLGHSTIVFGLTLAIPLATAVLPAQILSLGVVGSFVGTLVSSGLLFMVGGSNLIVLYSIGQALRGGGNGPHPKREPLQSAPMPKGLLGHVFMSSFRMISHSWQLFPLGLLFGLGFDTATEIGLLGISARQIAHGLPIWSVLIFPAIFAVGMMLADTVESLIMVGAYGWAFVKPGRKLYYNFTITMLSVIVAFTVASIELLDLAGDFSGRAELGGFWTKIDGINVEFSRLGCVIAGCLMSYWLISVVIDRMKIPIEDRVEIISTQR
jgi:high-affinity nickel-transport protein